MSTVQTVLGPISAAGMGWTLPHEHIMVDFVGADKTGPERWKPDEVVARMRPFLDQAVALGVKTFVDCTPAYLGRNVSVLQRLSRLTSLHILTNTGWYQAPYLPPRAFELEAEAIADEWIAEWEQGIGGTDIKPGFIKIAVNPGPLLPVQAKIVRAAALTSRATGLTVAAHTGHYQAAQESLDIAETAGLDLDKYIVVHAQNIVTSQEHRDLAARGVWLEYDGIGPGTVARHVDLVVQALAEGYEGQVLLSHDAGWYSVGEANGGEVRAFTMLHDALLPALHEEGIENDVVEKLCIENPARAFVIG